MAKKVQLMTNPKQWQVVDGVEVLVDVPQEDIDPITDSSCVEIEGHRTLEETISQENMFTPEIVETKVHSKVGGVYHDNVVDGAYEEAILYGNTQVNLVESMTNGTKYIPHSFTSFQGKESEIGNYYSGRTNQVAPLVKGVTMVNLCQETSRTIPYQHTMAVANHNAKPNTKYTLKCKFTEKNKNAGIMIQSYGYKDGTWGYVEISKTIQNLGDDVLLTFTTHEQADSIIIYNNPAFCEDENDSITLDDIMVIEGDITDLDLPFFKGMRSVELSRPLTNLFTDDTTSSYPVTNTNGTVTVTSDSIGSWKSANFFLQDSLKPNTKYIVMWDSLTATQTSVGTTIINTYDTVNNISLKASDSDIISPTLRSYVFDTGNVDVNDIVIRIHATTSNSETGTTTVTGLRVFEWDDSLRTLDLQTIGYFSGTKYVSAPRTLETVGKNLYPYGNINFTNDYVGWCDAKGKSNMYGDIAQKSSTRFLLKKGTYTFSIGSATNVDLIHLIDDKEQQVGHLGHELKTFTLTQDTYCTIRVKTKEANVATTVTNIQIERGETATTYEGYSSRYYKPRETEEIILRSLPNGVYDTFNLQTGELVQNICYLTVKNGFTALSNFTTDTHATFAWSLSANNVECKNHTVFYSNYPQVNTYTTDSVEGVAINSAGNQLTMRIAKSKYASYETFNGYLTDNPLIIQYELKEPIITKLQTYNRVYSGQSNVLASIGNNLAALKYDSSNYYLKVSNLSPVPAILEPITSVPYDVRLKPSTLYTVKYNRGGNSNSMSFDLGGSVVEKTNAITNTTGIAEELTVRTPAILSHEQLILSGTGFANNFIVVEGDITGTELLYFEGMKDVKMPIVKNIGKNLFHGEFELGTMSSATGQYTDVTTAIRATDYTRVMGGKQYVFYSNDSQYKFAYVQYDKDKKFLRTSGSYYSGQIYKPQIDVEYVIIRTPDGQSPLMNNPHVKLALYEYEEGMDTTLQDYKENSVYAVQGEYPITSEMIEQGGFSTGDGTFIEYEEMKYEASIRLRSKDLIPIKPNTTYHIDATNMGGQLVYNVYQWNGNRGFMEGYSYTNNDYKIPFTFTTTADTQYIHILCSKYGNGAIAVAEYDWSQFHMYELDSTINLRSLPNGVKDELNLLTGEYIQRVGEVVLDNTETWSMDTTENATQPNTNIFYTGVHSDFKPLATVDRAGSLVCDKVNVVPDLYFVDKVGIMSNTDPRIYVRVSKTDSPDVATFTTYIQNNPLTLQYELAEPITSHVRLVSNNQEREVGVKLPNGVSNTYNPSTGITTVRVGKAIFDGSADEGWRAAQTDPNRFVCEMLTDRKYYSSDTVKDCMLCDKIVVVSYKELYGTNGTDGAYGIAPYGGNVNIQMRLKDITTVEQLQQYLSQNPITVWYELNYPQIQPDIVLPNGVHDEYNPETGVYVKRVEFTELDGSADEGWETYTDSAGGLVYFRTPCPLMRVSDNQGECKYVLSDSITVVPYSDLYNGLVTLDKAMSGVRSNALNKPCIYIYNSEISDESILKTSLSQNPVKVWYELATPITYQLTPYFGLPQPYAYEDGYLIHDSAYPEATLPPEFKYKLVANRTGQVMQNNRKLQEHTTRLSNLEALIIEATIQSLFDRELQTFELELMDIQLIDLGE